MEKPRRIKKLPSLILILAVCIFLTGCWDKIEIEDRLFVGSIAFDEAPAEQKQGKYIISYTSAVPTAIKEGKEDAIKTYSMIADNITRATGRLTRRYSQQQFFGHTKFILFSEAVLKDSKGVKEILDSLIRAHDFHKSMEIFMTKGSAEQILKVKVKFDSLLAYYITGIADNNKYSSAIQRLTLEDFVTKLVNNRGDAVIPRIEADAEEAVIEGLGVIKDYKFQGYLNADEGKALRWLTNDANGGMIELKIKDTPVVFRFYEFKTIKKLDKVKDGKIYLTYRIVTEGSIEEFELGQELLKEENLNYADAQIKQNIMNTCQGLIKTLQEKYKVDVIEAGDYLSKFHPKLYKQIGGNFDDYFSDNIVINVEVDAEVRRGGTMR